MATSSLKENFAQLLETTINPATRRRWTLKELAEETQRRAHSYPKEVAQRRNLSRILLWELLNRDLQDVFPVSADAFETLAEVLGVELEELAGTDYALVESRR